MGDNKVYEDDDNGDDDDDGNDYDGDGDFHTFQMITRSRYVTPARRLRSDRIQSLTGRQPNQR